MSIFFPFYFAAGRPESGRRLSKTQNFQVMEQLNRIELRGNVGNIRVRDSVNGQYARLSVATNYAFRDKDGVAVIETTWHNVVAWGGKGMPDLTTIKNGSPVYVVGRLRSRKFVDDEGQEHQINEVVARTLEVVKLDEQLVPAAH